MTQSAARLAPTDPDDGELSTILKEIEQAETAFASWDRAARDNIDAYRRALDRLHATALRRLIKTLRNEPHAHAALRAAVDDEIVHATLRYHQLVKPSLNERIETALDTIRPLLASHGGGVDLLTVEPPRIAVRFTGNCTGCAASMLTFHAGVKKAVQDACPEITDIVETHGDAVENRVHFVSPFAPAGWLDAGALSDIPDEGIRSLDITGVPLLLFRRGNAATCFKDSCGHLGQRMTGATVRDGIITCPHHGFRYDLETGTCLTTPAVRLHRHDVRVLGGRVEVGIVP